MKAKTNHTYYLCPKKNGMPDITPNPENTLHIKNMVCNRCIMVVKSQLEQLGLHPLSVELGIAVLPDAVSDETYQRVKASLETFGFELTINVCASSNRFGLQSSNWYITMTTD